MVNNIQNIKKRADKEEYRLGIYGGTFDPPHIGHIKAAKAFYNSLCLDRMLIIPTFIPPHKRIDISDRPLSRLDMLKAAFRDIPEAEICDYEISNHRPSYTVLTIEHFSAPNTHIFFLCGTDMFLTLENWYQAPCLLKSCTIALIKREPISAENDLLIDNYKTMLEKKYGADIVIIDEAVPECSSTQIRELIKTGGDLSVFLPGAVIEYIRENHLYGS